MQLPRNPFCRRHAGAICAMNGSESVERMRFAREIQSLSDRLRQDATHVGISGTCGRVAATDIWVNTPVGRSDAGHRFPNIGAKDIDKLRQCETGHRVCAFVGYFSGKPAGDEGDGDVFAEGTDLKSCNLGR